MSAKGGYHVNDKYPYRFKPQGSSGVRFAAPVFSTEAVLLEPMRATMKVDFTPEAKGDCAIAGSFAFSVCREDRCLVEKRNLEMKVSVID